jgi:magnesium chelatase family protein
MSMVSRTSIWKPSRAAEAGRELLLHATERMYLTARGCHRVLRVARTIADRDGAPQLSRTHIAEALSFRRIPPERQ